jgi:hypothetical protein
MSSRKADADEVLETAAAFVLHAEIRAELLRKLAECAFFMAGSDIPIDPATMRRLSEL